MEGVGEGGSWGWKYLARRQLGLEVFGEEAVGGGFSGGRQLCFERVAVGEGGSWGVYSKHMVIIHA